MRRKQILARNFAQARRARFLFPKLRVWECQSSGKLRFVAGGEHSGRESTVDIFIRVSRRYLGSEGSIVQENLEPEDIQSPALAKS